MEEDATKTVIKTLKAYLHRELPPDKDFFHELNSGRGFLASNTACELAQLADQGKQDCVWKLVTYIERFYTEELLLRLCAFLEEYAQQARPKLATIASKIRQEISKHKPQATPPVPKDPPHHRSAGGHHAHTVPDTFVPATFPPGSSSPEPPAPDTPAPSTLSPGTSVPGPTAPGAPMSLPPSYTSGNCTSSADMSQHVYYPVIDDLKISFSNLAGNVLSIIGSLCLKTFCYFLLTYLRPSFPPDAPLPVIPETVQDLKPFLIRRWDPLQIALLKAVVEHLASRRIQAGNFKENVNKVKDELNAYEDLLKGKLPEFLSKSTSESVSLQSYPGQSYVSVKIASNPAGISLSRIVELKGFFIHNLGLPDTMFAGFSEGSIVVLFFSIPTECVWSLPSCLHPSNLSLLGEWKVLFLSVKGAFTVNVDIKERTVMDKHSLLLSLAEDKIINDDLQTKVQQLKKDLYLEEELRRGVEGELKVLRKGKGKAGTTDREVEEKVSFDVKTELFPYLDIKTELSPDVSWEPSSKRVKTGSDFFAYEPPLEKKSEEKVFRSDLVRPGELHSVRKMPDLLIPTYRATPVTIGRNVYLAGGGTGEVKTEKLVQVYNMDSGCCRTLPPSPQYRSAAVAIDGTLVLIGGKSSSTGMFTNMVSTWMAAEERWTQDLPPMKMKRHRPGVLLLNSHLFVFGGVGEDVKTCLDSFEVLDLNTKQWSEGRGGLPQPLSSPQLGVFVDYVMLYGGWTSGGEVTRVCYTVPVQTLVDSATNPLSPPIHWTPVQNAPYFCSALLMTSHDAVLIGGHRDRLATGAIHSSGSWEVIGELSEPCSEPAVVAVSDKSFLVLAGDSDPHSSSFSKLLKSVELISY